MSFIPKYKLRPVPVDWKAFWQAIKERAERGLHSGVREQDRVRVACGGGVYLDERYWGDRLHTWDPAASDVLAAGHAQDDLRRMARR